MNNPGSFDTTTGLEITTEQDTESGKKKNKKLRIGLLIAAFILICALVAGLLIFFGNSRARIIRAFKNTYSELDDGSNKLVNALDTREITSKKDYTISLELDGGIEGTDFNIDADIMIDKDMMQIEGNAIVSFIPSIEFALRFDKDSVSLHIPMIKDYLFVYNYRDENDGYLARLTETGDLDAALSDSYDVMFSKDIASSHNGKELLDCLVEELKDTEVNKLKAGEYEIDGNDVKCTGYEILVSESSIENILDELSDREPFNTIRVKEDLKDILDQAGDVTIEVYIYKNKLAAVNLVSDLPRLEILFEGGDYRCQNVKAMFDDEELFLIKGELDETTETASLSVLDRDILSYEYDLTEGDLDISVYNMYRSESKIKNDGRSLEIDLDFIDVGDSYAGGSIKIKKGASPSDMSGKEFDVGNATEDEINDLISEIYSVAAGIAGKN